MTERFISLHSKGELIAMLENVAENIVVNIAENTVNSSGYPEATFIVLLIALFHLLLIILQLNIVKRKEKL